MASTSGSNNIFSLMKTLSGNSWNMVRFQPMFGIPLAFFNFYLSLYMKSQGVSDRQIGYLISIGFVTGSILSMFSGVITDRLGRKKTTLIFDFLSWPVTLLIYLISDNFWLFAIGAVTNSCIRVNMVSWNLMIVEDATNDQRVAAYNYNNIVNTAAGILTPLGGILVKSLGVANAEKIFLTFAVISISAMIFIRNRNVVETKTGKEILERNKEYKSEVKIFKGQGLYRRTFEVLKKNPAIMMVMGIFILFNVYIPIGTFNSLYFAPYLSDYLGLDKSTISILGSVNSIVMLVVMIFINPILNKFNVTKNMIAAMLIQIIYLIMFIVIPSNSFIGAALSVAVFSLGFGVFLPYINALLAKVTDGCEERAGIYSLNNTIISVISIVVTSVSGNLYVLDPRSIYIMSIVLLIIGLIVLVIYMKKFDRSEDAEDIKDEYMEVQAAEN